MNNDQNINNMKERMNTQNQINPDVQNMQNIQNNMANMNLNNAPQHNLNSFNMPSLPTIENNNAIPSPVFESKPLEELKESVSNIDNKKVDVVDNSIPQPPSIKVLNFSENANEQQKYVEINKEVIPDRHLEIDDEVNPITSDLNRVSVQVRKHVSDSKSKKYNSSKNEKSIFDRNPNDMEMLQNYVGRNSGKLIDKFLNVNAIVFGPLYYAYRKMYCLGILFFIGLIGVSYYCRDLYISLGYILFVGLLFNPLYNIKIRKEVMKIKKKYNGADALSLNQICINKGGTSKFRAIFALLSELVILYGFIVFVIPNQFIEFAGEYGLYVEINNYIMKASFDEDKLTEKLTKEGLYINKVDKEFIINDYFDIGLLPERFKLNKEKSNDSMIRYEVNDLSGINRCRFDIKAVVGYEKKEDLINNLVKIYKSEVTKDYVNEIDWICAKNDISLYRYYYYVTEVDEKVVVLTFRTSKNSLKACKEVEDNILNLIKRK